MIFIQHLAIGVIVILMTKRSQAPPLATVSEIKSVTQNFTSPTNASMKKVTLKCGWRPKCSKQWEIWNAVRLMYPLKKTDEIGGESYNKKKDKQSRNNSYRSRKAKIGPGKLY